MLAKLISSCIRLSSGYMAAKPIDHASCILLGVRFKLLPRIGIDVCVCVYIYVCVRVLMCLYVCFVTKVNEWDNFAIPHLSHSKW